MEHGQEEKSGFDFDRANLADQITVVGACQHLYDHACKSASVSTDEEAIFFMTVADMAKQFRRDFSRRHFPSVSDKEWCMLKAVEEIRQRVYESASTSHEDLVAVNSLWATVTEHIFGVDLTDCVVCKADKEEDEQKQSD